MKRRGGVPMVVSAPSGGGKTTLCHRLIESLGGVEFSVSHTTRAARPGERNGVDYHFVSKDEFEDLVKQGAFLEWAWVHGNRYGTTRIEASTALTTYRIMTPADGLPVDFNLQQGGTRYVWDGATSYGMIERSCTADQLTG